MGSQYNYFLCCVYLLKVLCANLCCVLLCLLLLEGLSASAAGQRTMMAGKKWIDWCWVTAGAGGIAMDVCWSSSVAVLCLSCAVMLVLKFSKLKACEVVCRAPLAHQGRLQHVRIKKQAWGSCSSVSKVLEYPPPQQLFFFLNLKFNMYCGGKKNPSSNIRLMIC